FHASACISNHILQYLYIITAVIRLWSVICQFYYSFQSFIDGLTFLVSHTQKNLFPLYWNRFFYANAELPNSIHFCRYPCLFLMTDAFSFLNFVQFVLIANDLA